MQAILFSIWHHSKSPASNKQPYSAYGIILFMAIYLFIVLDFYWSHSKLGHAYFENEETRFINCQRTVDFLPSNLQCSTCRIKNETKFTGQSIRFIHVYAYNLIELACIYTCGREIRVISLLGTIHFIRDGWKSNRYATVGKQSIKSS